MNTHVITSAVIKYKNKYLIGKRAETKKSAPNQWEFISGFIDTKETAEEIILRELKEETSLKGKIVKSGSPYFVEDKEAHWVIIPFLIEVANSNFILNPADHSELKWVAKEELLDYKELRTDIQKLKNSNFIL